MTVIAHNDGVVHAVHASGRGGRSVLRRLAGAALLLLAALASAAFTVPAVAQMAPAHCDASDVNEVWCAVLTVGVSSSTNFRGFAGIDNSQLRRARAGSLHLPGRVHRSVLRLNEGRGSQGPPRLSFSIYLPRPLVREGFWDRRRLCWRSGRARRRRASPSTIRETTTFSSFQQPRLYLVGRRPGSGASGAGRPAGDGGVGHVVSGARDDLRCGRDGDGASGDGRGGSGDGPSACVAGRGRGSAPGGLQRGDRHVDHESGLFLRRAVGGLRPGRRGAVRARGCGLREYPPEWRDDPGGCG